MMTDLMIEAIEKDGIKNYLIDAIEDNWKINDVEPSLDEIEAYLDMMRSEFPDCPKLTKAEHADLVGYITEKWLNYYIVCNDEKDGPFSTVNAAKSVVDNSGKYAQKDVSIENGHKQYMWSGDWDSSDKVHYWRRPRG